MRLVCIVGPTASGKSALALDLAERLGGEIVSADSRQVYRDLEIGTAKPTAAERARVPHHCLDLVAPSETFDAARFRDAARAAIADIVRRGRVALVVGGTGLYVRVLLGGLCPAPPRVPALRRALAPGRPASRRSATASCSPAWRGGRTWRLRSRRPCARRAGSRSASAPGSGASLGSCGATRSARRERSRPRPRDSSRARRRRRGRRDGPAGGGHADLSRLRAAARAARCRDPPAGRPEPGHGRGRAPPPPARRAPAGAAGAPRAPDAVGARAALASPRPALGPRLPGR